MKSLVILIAGFGLWAQTAATAPRTAVSADDSRGHARVPLSYSDLPLSFIENQGQVDQRVAFYAPTRNYGVYFTEDGHTIRLKHGRGDAAKAHIVKVELVDSSARKIEGSQPAPGIVSYFKGPREGWRTGLRTHDHITYVQPWKGIDLAYTSRAGQLESIYTVAPHADPGQIRLRYSGQNSLQLDQDGALTYTTSVGEVKETAPTLYQNIRGKRVPVRGRFLLLDKSTVAFEVAKYDRDHALVIDPTLVYSGLIGGSGSDHGNSIAVGADGSAYVTGLVDSADSTFPVLAGPDPTYNGGIGDVFVAKLNPSGTALVYSGFIGGSGVEQGFDIAVDRLGNAYITGYTDSTAASFPVVGGPSLTYGGGLSDAFIAKVNASGTALLYSGYIGGNDEDLGTAIALDDDGNAYITGPTRSTQASFPVLGGPSLIASGGYDAFVAKVNPAGTTLVYAGYIGGSGLDQGRDIDVDDAGNAYVTGFTNSTEASFPVLVGPDLSFNGGAFDAFVAKVAFSGAGLEFAGYIGGSGSEQGSGIAVDGAGRAHITGHTDSNQASFPVVVGPDLTYNGGPQDAFVARVDASGATLLYSGYIGGSGQDWGQGIAVDRAGYAYVVGFTSSTEPSFPVRGGPDLTANGEVDGFVSKVSLSGGSLLYSGFIGGSASDFASGVDVDSSGSSYVTGRTNSSQTTFPIMSGPGLDTNRGGVDAFFAKIDHPLEDIFSNGFE